MRDRWELAGRGRAEKEGAGVGGGLAAPGGAERAQLAMAGEGVAARGWWDRGDGGLCRSAWQNMMAAQLTRKRREVLLTHGAVPARSCTLARKDALARARARARTRSGGVKG